MGEASYDSRYGARTVERHLEATVVTQLSKMLISGEISSGSVVRIEASGGTDGEDDDDVPLRKKARLLYSVSQDDSFMDTDENNPIAEDVETGNVEPTTTRSDEPTILELD